MLKKIILIIPFLFCIISCDGFSTGGNPDEGRCTYVLREHPNKMVNSMSVECPYDSVCNVKIYFGIVETSFVDGCIGDYEYRFAQDKVAKVSLNSNIDLNIDSDDHVRFSLYDDNDIEKKYDIDLSDIIHPYTISGDSVEVKKYGCLKKMNIYKSKGTGAGHDIIELYPDSLKYGKYVFFQDSLFFDYLSFNCGLKSQSSFESDSLFIYGRIYWR